MKYAITVKHTLTGVTTGFNLNITNSSLNITNSSLNITNSIEGVSTDFLLRIKEIMDTDFVGFYIAEITLEDY